MTDYRKQHPVCIVRDVDGSSRLPHQLWWGSDDDWITDELATKMHDAGVPWSTDEPLPEGVFGGDRHFYDSTTGPPPAGWETVQRVHVPQWLEVRRVPKPKTKLVPWWEALTDKRKVAFPSQYSKGGKTFAMAWGAEIDKGAFYLTCNGKRSIPADPDGMVEVLALDGES